ncbi:helix-turn-helix transcriptional regulator [Halosimplex litoreum]|uniref:Helix-turn-helix transcriptional regulator n=1 Tax=Halosimplex litoreum TaxID=1198301 RepID=A0A7T3KU10_9EURY|nr:helix-turn-helix domain-containing protein [Halosimplex litoreum]QPV61769.1 helix-turn-helix transcriptional regulator [Halosimplex litoreum]
MTAPVDDPAEAFDVLGDQTRLSILRALADADEPLSFTRLRERCGVADSGRFSYHLRRLCEYFVRETGDGYELGHAGSRVIAATGDSASGRPEPSDAAGSEARPVWGDEGCGKLFHVHLSAPWRAE